VSHFSIILEKLAEFFTGGGTFRCTRYFYCCVDCCYCSLVVLVVRTAEIAVLVLLQVFIWVRFVFFVCVLILRRLSIRIVLSCVAGIYSAVFRRFRHVFRLSVEIRYRGMCRRSILFAWWTGFVHTGSALVTVHTFDNG